MDKIRRIIPIERPYKLPFESNKWGGAYFDGLIDSNSYIKVNKAASINNLTTISILAIIVPYSGGVINFGRIFDKGTKGMRMASSRLNCFHIFSVTGGDWQTTALNSIVFRQYNHVAITYDNTNVVNSAVMYVNGISKAVTENVTPNGVANLDVGQDIFIGNSSSITRTFDGLIIDIIYINGLLTQPQIQDIMYGRILPTEFDCRLWHDYRLGHAFDLSGNNNNGILVGNVRFV